MHNDLRKWIRLVEDQSIKYAFEDAETPDDILRILQELDAREVKLPDGSVIYLASGWVIEWDGKDIYPDIEDAYQWVNDADFDRYFPDHQDEWNARFWEYPEVLYHATTEQNAAVIERQGLRPQNATRGLSNRSVGGAIFTTSEFEDTMSGSYGDVVFAIDTTRLAADKRHPYATREPNVEEGELQSALAHALGLDDFEPNYENDMSPNTVILYGAIPRAYLTRED
jgi:hypothetical protein